MAKTRQSIPTAVRSQVLDEFNHRCAICGADKPHIHHIDENPANNDPMNLIPLCPNCHLTDQHNPTQPLESGKLRLFRQYKDPTMLKPQFHPLFVRLQFLDCVNAYEEDELRQKAAELADFVRELEMGAFYSKAIAKLLSRPVRAFVRGLVDPTSEERYAEFKKKGTEDCRRWFDERREEVYKLAVELLRYQRWQDQPDKKSSQR